MALTLCEAISLHANASADGKALVTDADWLSWSQLQRMVTVTTHALKDYKLEPGDRVATVTDNPFAFVAACAAAEQCRCVCAPLSPDYAPDVMQRVLEHFAPNVIVADRAEQNWPSLATSDLVERGRGRTAPPALIDASAALPTDPFIVLYTSGTTATPRGTERDLRTCTAWWNILAEYQGLRFGGITTVATPIAAGMGIGCILPTVVAGGTCRFSTPFNAERFIQISRAERPTFCQLTPTHWTLIVESPEFSPESFASYTRLLSGGARLDAGLRAKLIAYFPQQFVEQYGTSESGAISLSPACSPAAKKGSVGRAFRDVMIKILEGDEEQGPDLDGEIAVHTSRLMTGYFLDAEATNNAWWLDPESGTRFYRTGDLGRIDGDGYLWILGRKKELIISGGQNVYATDLEAVLETHPDVADVAVVARPNEILGEVPVAFVVLEPTSTVSQTEICRWANARLRKAQRLYKVFTVSVIPKNANGKPMKRLLEDLD